MPEDEDMNPFQGSDRTNHWESGVGAAGEGGGAGGGGAAGARTGGVAGGVGGATGGGTRDGGARDGGGGGAGFAPSGGNASLRTQVVDPSGPTCWNMDESTSIVSSPGAGEPGGLYCLICGSVRNSASNAGLPPEVLAFPLPFAVELSAGVSPSCSEGTSETRKEAVFEAYGVTLPSPFGVVAWFSVGTLCRFFGV